MNKKINIYISFDLEGISGVSSWREMKKDSPSLGQIRKIATEEVNAVMKGLKKSGVEIGEITINDAHAEGENLLIDQLERGVNLIKGTPRKYYMIEGINEHYDIIFFIGYHAMAGTKAGGMDHTYSSATIYNVMINGRHVGEAEINAAVAGYYGIPLGLVSGDNLLIAEIKRFFGKQVETVITKYGISRFAAKCRHPTDVQNELQIKATRAIKKIKQLKPFRFKTPISAGIEVTNSLIGDAVEPLPGLKRVAARKFQFKSSDVLEFYRTLRLICNLGGYANTVLV